MKRAAILCMLLQISIAVPQAQVPTLKMDGYPDAGAPPIVKLLSPGSGTRTALRFAVAPSYKEHVDLGVQMSMAMTMGGNSMPAMAMPTITIGADIAVTNVAANGDVTYTMTFSGITVAPGADPNIANALQGLDGALKGMKGTATLTNRGITRSVKMEQASAANAQFAQMLSQLSSQAQSLSIPLPEEEVGVGARWEARQSMVNGGMQVFQRFEYELAAFDGKTATMKVKVEQTAPAQDVANPQLPAGATMHLLNLAGAGTGTTAIRLDGLMPTSSVNMESVANMEMAISGNTQTMGTKTTMKMTCTPKK